MSLARRLMAAALPAAAPAPSGQQQWTTPGTFDFVVPDDVHSICVAVVQAGYSGNPNSPFNGGRGGGLNWVNDIPVTPGETLTVIVGAKGTTLSTPGGPSRLRRSGVNLAEAAAGRGRFDLYGGGGGDGGAGNSGGNGNGGMGGGAAGYTGDGGRGGNYLQDTRGGEPTPPDCGGGRGGDKTVSPSGWADMNGEGVGLQGRTPDKAYGSAGLPKVGGGGCAPGVGNNKPQDGGVRIIWGDGREYPDGAAQRVAIFVGFVTGSEVSLTAALPEGAKVGDYVVIQYYSGRTIGGGGGAFTTYTQGTMKVSHRKLLAADFTTPITFSEPTPYIVGVWDGPNSMSAVKSTLSWTTPTSNDLDGFSPAANSALILGVGAGATTPIFFNPPPFSFFENGTTRGSSGLGFGMGSIEAVYLYEGQDLTIYSNNTSQKYASLFELLF